MIVQRKLKTNGDNKTRHGNKEETSKPSKKRFFFVDETNQTILSRSYSYKSDLNAKTGSCSEASSSEEEDTGIRKCRRKSRIDKNQ